MKYGYFDDSKREYVIETPYTPLPWINYLGSQDFFGLISNTGGGYDFYRDAKLRRLTRYRYNSVPRDTGGRMYYITADGGATWSPAFKPAMTRLDKYRCRHGLGYTVFESARDGLGAELTCFVPVNANSEINRLVLKNLTGADRKITVVSAVEWCLWNAVDDGTNFQRNLSIGEVEIEGSTIYHKTEYRERRNHYAFYSVNHELAGFDTDLDTFLGAFNGYDAPQAVINGASGNSIVHGWSPIGSHRVEFTLSPGEEKELIFILGYVELPKSEKWEARPEDGIINKRPARDVISSYNSRAVTEALAELAAYWDGLLGKFQIESSDDKLDRMVNIWHQYQCMTTFNMSRSASYYESGTGRGMGFRDSCQDLLGFVHIIPERARARILDIAAIQFENGGAWHQYQPLTKRGNAEAGMGFNDDPLWLVACVHAYIAETGDYTILDEPVPFNNTEGTEKPLFEHLKASFHYTLNNTGPHGLPLIGRADWNDCINLNCYSEEPGESFQTCANIDSDAESVFIAAMFVLYGRKYAELCAKRGETYREEKILADNAVAVMEKAIKTHGWDGEWFLRAYDSNGQKVGSSLSPHAEGQIFIEPQGMCVMAGVGSDDGLAEKALASVRNRLTFEYGTCLVAPCFKTYRINLGEIGSYPQGYKENGSVFCHNNPWISIAEAVNGNADEAFEAYRRICPAYIEDISEIHRTEPYVYSQMVAGRESAKPGEAKNSWLTGTAAWAYVNVSQYLLGIRPELDGLRVEPCLPDVFDNINVRRFFRGATYNININRAQDGQKGLFADGKPIDGNIIPAASAGTVVDVEYRI